MAYPTYTSVINLVSAGRGASGTTGIHGALRAAIPDIQPSKRVQQAADDQMPRNTVLGAVNSVQVAIETEAIEAFDAALGLISPGTSQTPETIVLNFNDDAGTAYKYTCKFAKLTRVGRSNFPPSEEGGRVPKSELVFDLQKGSGVTKVSEAIVKTSGHASLT